jgi:hypothetical protein
VARRTELTPVLAASCARRIGSSRCDSSSKTRVTAVHLRPDELGQLVLILAAPVRLAELVARIAPIVEGLRAHRGQADVDRETGDGF